MDDAPLPPHERPWRHPSELGPTPALVEPSTTRSRALAFSSGAVAVVLVAVLVVTVTPRRTQSPNAVSATTIAAPSVQAISASATTPTEQVRVTRGISHVSAAALVGAPNAISSAPTVSHSSLDLAGLVPDDDTRVIVVTRSYTYDVAWGDMGRLIAPSGAVVLTLDGELLAKFVDDTLHVLVD